MADACEFAGTIPRSSPTASRACSNMTSTETASGGRSTVLPMLPCALGACLPDIPTHRQTSLGRRFPKPLFAPARLRYTRAPAGRRIWKRQSVAVSIISRAQRIICNRVHIITRTSGIAQTRIGASNAQPRREAALCSRFCNMTRVPQGSIIASPSTRMLSAPTRA